MTQHFHFYSAAAETSPEPVEPAELKQFIVNQRRELQSTTGIQLLTRAGHQLEVMSVRHADEVRLLQAAVTERDKILTTCDNDLIEAQEELSTLAQELGFSVNDEYTPQSVIEEIRRLRGVDAGMQGAILQAQTDYNELSGMLSTIFCAFGIGENHTREEATNIIQQLAGAFAIRNDTMVRIKTSLGLQPNDVDDEVLKTIDTLYESEPLTAIRSGQQWISDVIDLAHAVRGNFAPENRVMAKAAELIITSAPKIPNGIIG